MFKRLSSILAATLVALPAGLAAQTAVEDSAFMASLEWRSIGPANMSGRVTDIEGIPGTATFFMAGASSGIWKTENNGTTFRPVFDNERVISMGDLAIAPSNPDVVWAGTGEEDSRNSISPGGGIYKSTDGGITWELKGLEDTQMIGRIVVHPEDEDIVYVAAVGPLWNEGGGRGLYKTTDGGDSWERIHYVSDRAGFVDVDMHPNDPDVLWATSWERIRGPYFLQSGGPGSAIWKTTDGGENWEKVEGNGLPETEMGRLEIAIAPSYPRVMYAVVEAETPDEPDENGEKNGSGLYRSDDGGETWEFMNSENSRPFYYSGAWVSPDDPDFIYWSSLAFSRDGGKTVGNPAQGVHVDYHALWWDSENPDRFILGNDGGIAITYDRGGNFDFVNTVPMGQFYAVSYNMDTPYRVCGGLQDNYTWCGPSTRAGGSIDNHMWYSIGGGDGFYAPQDPTNPDIVFGESQGGRIYWRNTRTGERHGLDQPDWRERTKTLRDSIAILSGDDPDDPPASAMPQIEALRERVAADSALYDLRFNWNTPLELSPHDPQTLYIGSNRVLKWTYDTDEMQPISPDLSYADPEKVRISTTTTGGITPDVTGAETYATIVALAESPINEGELFAGTDDGRVWRSPEGTEWIELTDRFPGVPEGTYVSRVEPSSHNASRFYVTFDGHRTGDYTPYVYVTDDRGETFRDIASNLPTGGPDFVHVVREDPVNPDLLYVGTDVGVYVSTNRGGSWTKFMNGLPTVPVHDLKIHPRERELIAGTHGRSIWIADVAPLQQLDGGMLPTEPTLFDTKVATQYGDPPVGGEFIAQRTFQGETGSYGAEIAFYVPADVAEALAEEARAEAADSEDEEGEGPPAGGRAGMRGGATAQAQIAILAANGDTVQTMEAPIRAGLNRAYWRLNRRGEQEEEGMSPSERADSIRTARMQVAIADSLVENEGVDRELMDRVLELMQSGDQAAIGRVFGGGGGGGGGAARGGWDPRPAESYPEPAREGAQARGPAAGGEGGAGPAAMRPVFQQMFSAMRDRGAGGFGRFFRGGGGGGGGLAPAGTYTVAVTIGDETYTTPLEVVREDGFGFWEEEGPN
ncbi:MAG: hypothetical protein R3195_18630 [Gemmatimonadota bacterium]|nr:hypothetical protein [Gemmatimonadota bacterium]